MDPVYHSSKTNLKILKEKVSINKGVISTLITQSSESVVEATVSEQKSKSKNEEKTTRNIGSSSSSSLDLLGATKADLEEKKSMRKVKKFRKENGFKLLLNEFDVLKEHDLSPFYDDSDEFDFFDDDLLIKEEKESGPKNNYCQHFVDTGQRPQNFIRDPGLSDRFEEYPKLRELIKIKDELIAKSNVPVRPMYIKSEMSSKNGSDFSMGELVGSEFDVILVEPPLHEYQLTNNVHFKKYYSWDEIKAIDVASVAGQRCFLFLWCGSSDGLDKGRECMRKWGFRRCEDICWIKTNKNKSCTSSKSVLTTGIFQSTKEHCLMGIKGTVRRSTDSNFIHTNIDIDLIISEEPEIGNPSKPEEIFHIIEHFCLGKRRLYLFGRDDSIRPGWLTVGPDLSDTYFDREMFKNCFDLNVNGNLTGTSDRIEMLRPRTPPMKAKINQQMPSFESMSNSNFNNHSSVTTFSSADLSGLNANNSSVASQETLDVLSSNICSSGSYANQTENGQKQAN